METTSINKVGRKKLKRYSIGQLNNLLLIIAGVKKGKMIDFNYEDGEFLLTVKEYMDLKKYKISAKETVKKINSFSPSDYKKYNSNKEFYIDYNIILLETIKNNINNMYKVDIDEYKLHETSGSLVLMNKDNQLLTIEKRYYDNYKNTLDKVKER